MKKIILGVLCLTFSFGVFASNEFAYQDSFVKIYDSFQFNNAKCGNQAGSVINGVIVLNSSRGYASCPTFSIAIYNNYASSPATFNFTGNTNYSSPGINLPPLYQKKLSFGDVLGVDDGEFVSTNPALYPLGVFGVPLGSVYVNQNGYDVYSTNFYINVCYTPDGLWRDVCAEAPVEPGWGIQIPVNVNGN